jgi:hypothetical protein
MGSPEGQDDGPMSEPGGKPAGGHGRDLVEGRAEDELRRLLEDRPEPELDVAAALFELEAARVGLADSLDELTSATQSALDIPAKIRRHPARTAALVGGTGFLLAGGPRRVARYAVGRVLPGRRDRYTGLLPPQIERVLRDAGLAQDPEVRRALEADFADYLRQKGRYGPAPSASTSLWRTFDRVAGPLGTAGARLLVGRIMEAERERAATRAEARRTRAKGPVEPTA